MILHRYDEPQCADASEMLLSREEAMLNRPPLPYNGSILVRRLVGVEHLVDGGVAGRVRANAPPHAIELFHNGREAVRRNQLQAAIGALFSVWFLVRITHPAAFKSSI